MVEDEAMLNKVVQGFSLRDGLVSWAWRLGRAEEEGNLQFFGACGPWYVDGGKMPPLHGRK
jgi:hypothetical protein